MNKQIRHFGIRHFVKSYEKEVWLRAEWQKERKENEGFYIYKILSLAAASWLLAWLLVFRIYERIQNIFKKMD